MRLIKILPIFLLPVIFIQPQKKNNPHLHDFSGTGLISVSSIFTLGNTDYNNGKIGFGAVGMAEYFIPAHSSAIFGMRLIFGGQTVCGEDKFEDPDEFITDIYIVGGGLTAGYSFQDQFFPYIHAGVSNLWFDPKDINGKKLKNNSQEAYSGSTISYDIEVGSRIVLQKRLSMFFGAGMHFVQTDNFDDISAGANNDFYYSGLIGVSLSFFGHEDSDRDGFYDSDDPCPSNAEDYDGFQDEDGCPDYDNDKDKIVDEKDKCPNEPEDQDGFQDQDGCPDLDNDGDGIPDSKDKCPNQAENLNGYEDGDGCPDVLSNLNKLLDTDKDGLPDSADNCLDQAETFNGFQDDDGCPDSVVAGDTVSIKEIILEGSNIFEWRGSEIKPTAYEELDKTAEFLMNDPFIKWNVESFTDNNGDLDSLKSLSQERAISVVRYLINKGLPSFMFKIYARGSESPIAGNNDLEGRMKNNRIVIKRLE